MNLRTRGEAVKKSEIFADVLNGSSLSSRCLSFSSSSSSSSSAPDVVDADRLADIKCGNERARALLLLRVVSVTDNDMEDAESSQGQGDCTLLLSM